MTADPSDRARRRLNLTIHAIVLGVIIYVIPVIAVAASFFGDGILIVSGAIYPMLGAYLLVACPIYAAISSVLLALMASRRLGALFAHVLTLGVAALLVGLGQVPDYPARDLVDTSAVPLVLKEWRIELAGPSPTVTAVVVPRFTGELAFTAFSAATASGGPVQSGLAPEARSVKANEPCTMTLAVAGPDAPEPLLRSKLTFEKRSGDRQMLVFSSDTPSALPLLAPGGWALPLPPASEGPRSSP